MVEGLESYGGERGIDALEGGVNRDCLIDEMERFGKRTHAIHAPGIFQLVSAP